MESQYDCGTSFAIEERHSSAFVKTPEGSVAAALTDLQGESPLTSLPFTRATLSVGASTNLRLSSLTLPLKVTTISRISALACLGAATSELQSGHPSSPQTLTCVSDTMSLAVALEFVPSRRGRDCHGSASHHYEELAFFCCGEEEEKSLVIGEPFGFKRVEVELAGLSEHERSLIRNRPVPVTYPINADGTSAQLDRAVVHTRTLSNTIKSVTTAPATSQPPPT
ncbi:hypothetical protein KCU98_g551, partial [Aureobasidium melanogenum]